MTPVERKRGRLPLVEPAHIAARPLDGIAEILAPAPALIAAMERTGGVYAPDLRFILCIGPQLVYEAIIGAAMIPAVVGEVATPEPFKLAVTLSPGFPYDLFVGSH
jgi:hypothetical protein